MTLPRYRTGDPDLDQKVLDLLEATGTEHDVDQLFEILASGVGLALDRPDRLDLKITNAALKEMRAAFRAFAPYTDVRKVTVFGSARTRPDDPLYAQARRLAADLAAEGWMVVTGAGPGIMQAATEGAGPGRAFGVSIRLPFEEKPAEELHDGDKLVTMKYFFTRKLMLMKESSAFVSLPGGFGTLDETFELLTLQQTGKATPAPIVLLDCPGETYWAGWRRFVVDELVPAGLISPQDLSLALLTDDATAAVREITGFYRNYHSIRWVNSDLVIRMLRRPTERELADLNRAFGPLLRSGEIRESGPLPVEVRDDDEVDLPRLVMRYNPFEVGSLHLVIREINRFGT